MISFIANTLFVVAYLIGIEASIVGSLQVEMVAPEVVNIGVHVYMPDDSDCVGITVYLHKNGDPDNVAVSAVTDIYGEVTFPVSWATGQGYSLYMLSFDGTSPSLTEYSLGAGGDFDGITLQYPPG